MQDQRIFSWYERHGKTPPEHTSHGIEDVREKLQPLKAHSWRLEGNRLVAKTDMGEVVNYIDPGVVMTGVDENNLPVFKRI